MSQAKVDEYKKEKANRKKIMAREKMQRIFAEICAGLIALAIVAWAGVSVYNYYESQQPVETVYVNTTALDDYIDSVDTAAE